MARVTDEVDKRTQLAGNNRLEVLMFYLGLDKQLYGINVFKVQEVIICPEISKIPDSLPILDGIVEIRGQTIPVIDLALAIGKTTTGMLERGYLIVTEYNKNIQGFRVSGVDRIVNMSWDEIKEPPKLLGNDCYLTAIAHIDGVFLEMIDVEKVISEFQQEPDEISEETLSNCHSVSMGDKFILIVDDSRVAIKQMTIPFDKLGIHYVTKNNGKEALDYLNHLVSTDVEKFRNLVAVISDLEMPLMDGYTLVAKIRKDEHLKKLHIILHSSLSGQFNVALVEKVGANAFVAKFDADLLGQSVIDVMKKSN